jgi:gluconolactonase
MLCAIVAAALWVPASAQEFGPTEISEVSSGHRFTDGPAWSPAGYLCFVDTPNNRLHQYRQGGQVSILGDQTFGASGLAFDKAGRIYIAEGLARRIAKIENGKHYVVVKDWEGKSFNSPNDLALRRNGDLYFTDPAYGSARKTRELDFHGVFRVSEKGEVSVVKRSQTRLNGIAFSPDDNTLYLTDSDRRVVLAMDVNNRGEVKNPAGLCVDTKGNIYVAANDLLVFDKSGKSIGSYRVAGKPSNCTFGEADGKALFVTSGSAVYRLRSTIPGLLPR